MQRFRGGLVFKAHRRVYHSTLGLRVIKKTRRRKHIRAQDRAAANGETESGPLRAHNLRGQQMPSPWSRRGHLLYSQKHLSPPSPRFFKPVPAISRRGNTSVQPCPGYSRNPFVIRCLDGSRDEGGWTFATLLARPAALSSVHGTYKTVQARFWPCLTGKSL